MKGLVEYIQEALLLEAYDEISILDEIEKTPGYDNSIKFKSKPKTLYGYKFNKTTGKFIKDEEFSNEAAINKYFDDFNVWIEDAELLRFIFTIDQNLVNKSVAIADNTKSGGIVIVTTSKDNAEIIKNYVKDNLSKFDKKQAENNLTKDEVDAFNKFFKDNVVNVETRNERGTFTAYFPSKDEVKKSGERLGYNNMPHLTISKPPRLKGGFGIMVYKKGRWAASEFPDPRKAFDADGNPKYGSIGDVINMLNKNFINGKWSDDLGAELK